MVVFHVRKKGLSGSRSSKFGSRAMHLSATQYVFSVQSCITEWGCFRYGSGGVSYNAFLQYPSDVMPHTPLWNEFMAFSDNPALSTRYSCSIPTLYVACAGPFTASHLAHFILAHFLTLLRHPCKKI